FKMACATCKYYQVVENFKMKKYSHYCFFFSTFMEKTKGRCESKRPIKASEPQDGEQKGGDG
ncbi:MAG: hypothetical protein M1610_06925, partial [Nitrospirae bacterium]|nr:hypothetical protein [Nitrospirota bacterium]MDA8338587.1 hypothetical protein [Nitrospiraceae bacterium]